MGKLALWEKSLSIFFLYTIYQNKFYIKYLKKYCTRLNYWKKKKKIDIYPIGKWERIAF